MLRGVVHDPTARRMGGVAGHAGLFSTAADLSRFCRMLLNGGTLDGVRAALAADGGADDAAGDAGGARPGARARLGHRHAVRRQPRRALSDRLVRAHRVDRAVALDRSASPARSSFSSRTACTRTGRATWWRCAAASPPLSRPRSPMPRRRATCASWAATSARTLRWRRRRRPRRPVLNGIDVLAADQFAILRGKRVGLVTNHTGRSRDGASTIDVLRAAPGVTLVSLFSPEHGIRGILDAAIPSSRDEKTGPADLLAVRRHAAADRRDARGARHDRHRPAGHRRAVLHLHDDDGVRHGGSGEAEHRRGGARPAQSRSTASTSRGRLQDEAAQGFIGVLSDARPPWDDARRAGAPVQRREQDRRGADGRADEELVARSVVRRDRDRVGEPVAEHAKPERGDVSIRASAPSSTPICRSGVAPTRRSSRSARRGSTGRGWPRR